MPHDLDHLQGAWTVTSLEMDGQAMPAVPAEAGILIQGKRFTSTGMGAEYAGTVRLYPSSSPPRIDLKFDQGPEKGNTNRGIYRFDGQTWVLCLATRGDGRPGSFASPPGSGIALETLVRGKPEAASAKTSKRPSKKSAAALSAAPATEWEGEWSMVTGVFSGAPMDASLTKWVKRETAGNQTTVTAGPQTMLKAEFTLDSSTTPPSVDYINLAGSNKGKPQEGIYELSGDRLTVCMGAPGSARPSAFQSKKGDGSSLTVWQRG